MSTAKKAQHGPAPSTAADHLPSPAPAYAYMMRCADGSLYSGWTNDLARRMRAHKTGSGARYTRARHGEALAYAERCADKSAALKREAALKKLDKLQKEKLAAAWAKKRQLTLRMATPDDAEAVLSIYRWYVTHSTATFQYDLPAVEDYRLWIAETLEKAPFLLAFGGDGQLLGYACAHLWHIRQAYAWDVETTVYCSQDAIGCGVGKRLYTALLALLKEQGYRNAFALVTNPNPGSEAFHKALGFKRFALEKHTGYKFGQWLNLGYWQLVLQPGDDEPAPVRYHLDAKTIRSILGHIDNENPKQK